MMLPNSHFDGANTSQSPPILDLSAAPSIEVHSNKRPHSPESASPASSPSSTETVMQAAASADVTNSEFQVSNHNPRQATQRQAGLGAARARVELNGAARSEASVAGQLSESDVSERLAEAHPDDQDSRTAARDFIQTESISPHGLHESHDIAALETPRFHGTLTPHEITRILATGHGHSSKVHHPSLTIWDERALAHLAASQILRLLTCTACRNTLVDPVSLPCGHNICMQCAHRRTRPRHDDGRDVVSQASSSDLGSHVPPRLPLNSLTVPCGDERCPRAAIGQGLGSWAGRTARYGAARSGHPTLLSVGGFGGAGALPVDGFIVGVPDHSLRLTVIPAQARSHAHLFAYGAEANAGDAADSLRVDVTLSKALGVLRRFVKEDSSPSVAAFESDGLGLSTRLANYDTPAQSYRHGIRSSHKRRNRPIRHGAPRIPIMGRYEEELESGTAGNLQAAEDDTDDEDGPTRQSGHWGNQISSACEDDADDDADSVASDASFSSALSSAWPDDIGGAYARNDNFRRGPRGWQEDHHFTRQARGTSKRRRRSNNHASRGPKMTLATKRQPSPLPADDEWDTEDSRPSTSGSADHRAQQGSSSVSASTGNGSQSARGVWNQLVNRFDRGERVDIAITTTQADEGPVKTSLLPVPISTAAQRSASKERSIVAADGFKDALLDTLYCDLVDVLECHVCYLLAYEPLTSPCGHSLCRTCLARSLDHSDRCPLCRAKLPAFAFYQEHPPNAAITALTNSEVDLPTMYDKAASARQGGSPSLTKWGLKSLFLERKAAVEEERRLARLSTPIFVCTLAFPGMPTILHIFEPRYRLMIRRCLESGNPRFGMVLPSNDTSSPVSGLNEYGTMLEIRSVQMLPDGRSLIETVGTHRFRLLDKGSLDGYTVGQIERFDDISPAAERALEAAALLQSHRVKSTSTSTSSNNSHAQALSGSINPAEPICSGMVAAISGSVSPPQANGGERSAPQASSSVGGIEEAAVHVPDQPVQSTQELIVICVDFIELVKSGSAPWLMSRLNSTYGPMPEPEDIERFGYWMALVIPIDEHEKAKLLPIRSPRLRLCLVVQWINQLRQSWWFNSGCSIS